MNQTFMLVALSVISLGLMGSAFVLLRLIEAQDQRQARLAVVLRSVGMNGQNEDPTPSSPSLLQFVASAGRSLARSGLLPASTIAELQQTLSTAGFRQSNALGLFIGAKLFSFLLLPVAAFFVGQQLDLSSTILMITVAAGAVLGMLGPDMLLRRMRKAHLKALEYGLPDALDMLVICAEAGLALEAGIDRVAAEIAPAHPAVARELLLTATELRILADRRVALANMGIRTGLSTLQRLGSTLIQTLQYGTPLGQVLRALASEMRYEMQMRFEAKAARLPVLLTLPMIVFILPCIFIVVGGPAGLSVQRALMHN